MEVENWENRRWPQTKEQVQRYRRQLTAWQLNERQQNNGDLRIGIWAIYFICWPVNKIGRGQYNIVSAALHQIQGDLQ